MSLQQSFSKMNDSLPKRLPAAILLALLLIAALWQGGWFFVLVICATLLLSVHEEINALKNYGYRPVAWPSYAVALLGMPLYFLGYIHIIMFLLPFLCIICMVAVMFRPEPHLDDIIYSTLPIFTIAFPGACLLSMAAIEPRGLQSYYLILLSITPILNDIFAYCVGSRIGKHKLCPAMSPNKTIEGALGGLTAGVLFTVLFTWIMALISPQLALPSLSLAFVFGIIISTASQMGDLFGSLVKRHCKIKDFGTLFPGHGGMMDRMDSILFSAVVVYMFYHLMLVI